MNNTIRALQEVLGEWLQADSVPEVDWSKLRALEFQETLRARDALVPRLGQFACTSCPQFEEHVSYLGLLTAIVR